MIDIKMATRAAIAYVQELQEYLPHSDDVRLEETEFVEPNTWLITLSFPADYPFTASRSYKEFRIDADNGHVMAMKVRQLTPAK
jgi:hypothetical protein